MLEEARKGRLAIPIWKSGAAIDIAKNPLLNSERIKLLAVKLYVAPVCTIGPERRVYTIDCCKKDPCNLNTERFVSKVGNPCPTLGQLLASRIVYALLVGEEQHEIARARFQPNGPAEVQRDFSARFLG